MGDVVGRAVEAQQKLEVGRACHHPTRRRMGHVHRRILARTQAHATLQRYAPYTSRPVDAGSDWVVESTAGREVDRRASRLTQK